MKRPTSIRVWEPAPRAETGKKTNWKVTGQQLPRNQHEYKYGYVVWGDREILIHKFLSDEEFASSLIHEALHITYPFLGEDEILRGEWTIFQLLRKLGIFEEE